MKEIGRYKEDFDVATQAKMFEDYKKNPKNKNFLPNSYVLLDISIGDKRLEKGMSLKVSSFYYKTVIPTLCYEFFQSLYLCSKNRLVFENLAFFLLHSIAMTVI